MSAIQQGKDQCVRAHPVACSVAFHHSYTLSNGTVVPASPQYLWAVRESHLNLIIPTQ
jgi:hypothetical protein